MFIDFHGIWIDLNLNGIEGWYTDKLPEVNPPSQLIISIKEFSRTEHEHANKNGKTKHWIHIYFSGNFMCQLHQKPDVYSGVEIKPANNGGLAVLPRISLGKTMIGGKRQALVS